MMVAHKLRPLPSPLLHAVVAVAATIAVVAAAAGRELESSTWWCGTTSDDASSSCLQSCPLGYGCADGTYCFSVATACAEDDSAFAVAVAVSPTTYLAATTTTTTSAATAGYSPSSSSSSSLGGLTGAAAVEETFLAMKTAIDERLFLYETPLMEWVPSTVYRFDGFFSGMQIMYLEGVAGDKLYLGGDCSHCHMYGLVNVAAFLAQAMKETIRYDACDENSWDRVGSELMYPLSNACGQLGQSYQDYHCSEEEKHMECEVDPEMTITAVTNAKWWGAPGPLQCGPKSLYPQTGYWDFNHVCDDIWAVPPKVCDDYEGQQGGGAINDAPYPNGAGRTDVEGCCWWGRGVIQTSGVCNFGKLNYFLGKRAADDGRESRYPDIDFCKDPEVICSSQEHAELKWIAGFFYWINAVQSYDEGGWNYINELHSYVDGGMEGDAFINAVSGIVNRGCHNPPCGTGDLDGGPERAQNFMDIVDEMKCYFVEVVPGAATPAQDDETALSTSPQSSAETPEIQVPAESSPSFEEMNGASERYECGEGDESDTTIEVTFNYEIHNKIEISVDEALKDIKESMLSDIAGRLGCSRVFWTERRLQAGFEHITGLNSNSRDLPDPDAAGCIVGIRSEEPTICTPVSGGFTLFAKPGTSEEFLIKTVSHVKDFVREGMDSGLYETAIVYKAIYIGDRAESNSKTRASSSTTANAQSEATGASNKGLISAVIGLSCACALLLCLLCLHVNKLRRDMRNERYLSDEEMAFGKYINGNNISHTRRISATSGNGWSDHPAPQVEDYLSGSQRRPCTPPLRSRNLIVEGEFEKGGRGADIHRPRPTSSRGQMDSSEKNTSTGRQNQRGNYSEPCVSLEGGSDSVDSSELTGNSSEDSSEGDTTVDNDIEKKIHIASGGGDKGEGDTSDGGDRRSNDENCPAIEIPARSNSLSTREERRKRLEHARARAAERHNAAGSA